MEKRRYIKKRINALGAILFALPFIICTAIAPAIRAKANPDAGVINEYEVSATSYTSGATNGHSQQNYEFDMKTNTARNLTTGEVYAPSSNAAFSSFNSFPVLYPGDTVTIIPDVPDASEEHHTGYCGYILNADNDSERVADYGPIHILKTATYGATTTKTFIQKFQIVGSSPVRIGNNGSFGGYANTSLEGKTYSINYYVARFSYNVLPNYCDIAYSYKLGDELLKDTQVAPVFNGENNLPEKVYAEDAFANVVSNGSFVITANRPFIEGYKLEKVTNSNSAYSNTRSSLYFGYQSFTGYDATFTLTPKMTAGFDGSVLAKGSSDDRIYVTFEYSANITLTVDVNDGVTAKQYFELWPNIGNFNNTMVAEPSRDGYSFEGWYPDGAEVNADNKITDIKEYIGNHFNANNTTVEGRACRIHAEWKEDVADGPEDPNPDYIEGKNLDWNEVDGKYYWFEDGFKQGTYSDPKGVIGDGTVRGREIYDEDTDAWYWLDSILGGAKAINKEVWMPYIYQNEENWSEAEMARIAAESDGGMEGMGRCVLEAMLNHSGKWVAYDDQGRMLKGWVVVSGLKEDIYREDQYGNTYYYDYRTGLMAKGWVTIDGVQYYFDEITGVLQK